MASRMENHLGRGLIRSSEQPQGPLQTLFSKARRNAVFACIDSRESRNDIVDL